MLAIAALVFALARPLATGNWMSVNERREVVLVLDNSMSSQQRVGEGINMTFDSSLLFATGSSTLGDAARSDLAAAATVFKKYDDTNILIEGHTDNTGTDAVNQPLSERRAASVS